jgi:hypothetical protein
MNAVARLYRRYELEIKASLGRDYLKAGVGDRPSGRYHRS